MTGFEFPKRVTNGKTRRFLDKTKLEIDRAQFEINYGEGDTCEGMDWKLYIDYLQRLGFKEAQRKQYFSLYQGKINADEYGIWYDKNGILVFAHSFLSNRALSTATLFCEVEKTDVYQAETLKEVRGLPIDKKGQRIGASVQMPVGYGLEYHVGFLRGTELKFNNPWKHNSLRDFVMVTTEDTRTLGLSPQAATYEKLITLPEEVKKIIGFQTPKPAELSALLQPDSSQQPEYDRSS